MLAEWSVECQAEDPVLIVPWSSLDSNNIQDAAPELRFVDLRANPYDLDHIPEAEQHPALLHALRALNAARSPVFTAKCDVWPMDPDEIETVRLNLDLSAEEALHGYASYIDLLWTDRSIFTSFHRTEQLLHRLTRHAQPLDLPWAMLDCVVRPAIVDLTGPQEGFAISLYVKAVGSDEPSAYTSWEQALAAVTSLLRAKDLALA